MGSNFLIKMDQQSICHLLTQPLISDQHIKWAAFIQYFYPLMQYHPGRENVVADALSRRPSLNHISVTTITSFDVMSDTYHDDIDFSSIWNEMMHNSWMPMNNYSFSDGFLFFHDKLCITSPFRQQLALQEMHIPPYMGHRGISTTLAPCKEHFYWPHMQQDVHNFVSTCMVYQRVKRAHGKPQGYLMSLPILSGP